MPCSKIDPWPNFSGIFHLEMSARFELKAIRRTQMLKTKCFRRNFMNLATFSAFKTEIEIEVSKFHSDSLPLITKALVGLNITFRMHAHRWLTCVLCMAIEMCTGKCGKILRLLAFQIKREKANFGKLLHMQ